MPCQSTNSSLPRAANNEFRQRGRPRAGGHTTAVDEAISDDRRVRGVVPAIAVTRSRPANACRSGPRVTIQGMTKLMPGVKREDLAPADDPGEGRRIAEEATRRLAAAYGNRLHEVVLFGS
jgi:hypothetical protein